MSADFLVNLNYVLPTEISNILDTYCEQNLVSPSALIRRLICEYIEHNRDVQPKAHPKGRRTTVSLNSKTLNLFDETVKSRKHGTKSSVIAALLMDFLPNRVLAADEMVNISVRLPKQVINALCYYYNSPDMEYVVVKTVNNVYDSIKSEIAENKTNSLLVL